MTKRCRCGGCLQRTDIKVDPETGLQYDSDEKVCHWVCVECKRIFEQKKRKQVEL